MEGISKFYTITQSEFEKRVSDLYEASMMQLLDSSMGKALYEAHQEIVMQVMEEGIAGSSRDHQVVSDSEPIYLVLIGAMNNEPQLSLDEISELVERDNIYGIIFINVDPRLVDYILEANGPLNMSHLREVHWYDDINQNLLPDVEIAYLPYLTRVGLYGYPYTYARRFQSALYGYPYAYTGRFQSALNDQSLDTLTIDTLDMRVNYDDSIDGSLIIPGGHTRLTVLDFDDNYPYRMIYSGGIPSNINWLVVDPLRSNVDNISEEIHSKNNTLYTLIVKDQTSNWNLPALEKLIELNVEFNGPPNMVPVTKYPNLEVLKLRYDASPGARALTVPQAFSRLKYLRVFHLYGDRLIVYPDVFNRLQNVQDLKVNSGLLPSMWNMPALEYLTIHNPEVDQLENLLNFVEEKGVDLSFSGRLMLQGEPLDREHVINEIENYRDSNIMVVALNDLVSEYNT